SRIALRISHVDRYTIADGLADWCLGPEYLWKACAQDSVVRGVAGRKSSEHDLISRNSRQRARVPAQQANGALHDCVEHWLNICLRPADHAQDVARGGLLVERRGQVPITRLQLLEQPHVLDSDHRLISEALDQRHLSPRKPPWLRPGDSNRADGTPFTHHGHG